MIPANMMLGQQPQQPKQPALNLTPIGFGFGRQFSTPASGFVNVGPGGMQAAPRGQQGNFFYGDTPPEPEGWRAVGMTDVPATDPRFFGPNGDRGVGTRRVMVWSKGQDAAGQGQGGGQEQGQGGAAGPAGPGIPGAPSLDQSQLNSTLAANQRAMDETRSLYARQQGDMLSTIEGLRAMLIQARNESANALMEQQQAFTNYMLINSDRTGAARAMFEGQLGRQAGGLPSPERGAVSPRFGDARTGGRNAAANTLSQLRIVSPGLLGGQPMSGSLGGLQIA